MKTWAKVPNVGEDWDLQVKLQWKRDLSGDWNRTLVIPFNEASCPGTADESGSADGFGAAPPQQVSSGGGWFGLTTWFSR